MNLILSFPLFAIVLCLLCSAVSLALGQKAARALSLGLSLVCLGLSAAVLWYGYRSGTVSYFTMGHFPRPWGNELRFSVIEPLMASCFALVLFLSLLGGKKQLLRDLQPNRGHFYYVLCDLLLAALLSLCYTNDLFTGYVFVEILTLSAVGILMIREIGRTTLASVRYLIFSLIGSGLFLMGVIILYGITGHLLMPNLKEAIGALAQSGSYRIPLVTAICLITLGLSVKSGLCPFHLWMPDTYGYATPSSSAILSGLVSKGYLVLLIKCIFDVFGTEVFYASGVQNVLFVMGIAGMLVGSVSAMREKEINRMLAYSSAAQIGYIYMGIGISPVLGMQAALFHILVHAFTKPLLFLSAAQLVDVSDGLFYRDLKDSAHKNRPAGVGFLIGAFSMIGIPLTIGFVSKYRFAVAAFELSSRTVVTLIALAVSTVLNTFYFARMVLRVYRPNEDGEKITRVRPKEQRAFIISALVLVLINIGCGIAADALLEFVRYGLDLL